MYDEPINRHTEFHIERQDEGLGRKLQGPVYVLFRVEPVVDKEKNELVGQDIEDSMIITKHMALILGYDDSEGGDQKIGGSYELL